MNDQIDNRHAYGRFIKPEDPSTAGADDGAAGFLHHIVRWLRGLDPNVLGIRLVKEDMEAGGRPMIHLAFPLGYKRSNKGGSRDRGTITDTLGPEIASGKRMNMAADANFNGPYSYLRLLPETLSTKVERDVSRLRESLRFLEEEIRPVAASLVSAAEGEIDQATIGVPADWEQALQQLSPDLSRPDDRSTSRLDRAAPQHAALIRFYLTNRGFAVDAVASLDVAPIRRNDESWLRISIPRGGNLRGRIPAALLEAGVKVMKNMRAMTDDEILGTVYCRAVEIENHLSLDPGSMREFRPRGGRRSNDP
ncbi:hypothetical protein [Paludisphaera rhizosphaerae]|uniref:hypothetical protein n=1 Tax=Paludisphaera rhizosphaerae TaxID=2711216 RepID=UPI0013EB8302|nr:hypothetical protein [Paludisphaera rhizosphaerae]